MPLRVSLERGQINNGQIGDEVGELGALGTDQQLTNEKGVPGTLGEHPRFDPVVRVGAAIEVLRVKRLAARVRDEVVVEPLEVFRRDLTVAVPPDRVLGQRINDRVLVLRGSPGMGSRFRAERTALHDRGFAARDRVLVEQRRSVVPVDRLEVLKAKSVGAVRVVPQTRFLHENLHDAVGYRPTYSPSQCKD